MQHSGIRSNPAGGKSDQMKTMAGSGRSSVLPYSSPAPVFVFCALATLMLFVVIQCSLPAASATPPNKLLLLLVDGFRWDYFDTFSDGELAGFAQLRGNGVAAEALIPAFPSLSYVNYYSIMTGNY